MTDLNKNFLTISAFATLSGGDEINERIDNIIQTTPGTHLFHRSFGFINRLIFANISDTTAESLMRTITSVLEMALPEITIDRVRSRCIPYPDENYYLIQLYYIMNSTGSIGTYQNTLEVNN